MKIKIGDAVVVTGLTLKDINNEMPTPDDVKKITDGRRRFGAMSIFGEDEDGEYIDAFISGGSVVFYTTTEDMIEIRYGGKVVLTYYVTEEALKDYGVTLKDYEEFFKYLKKLGGKIKVKNK